MLKFFQWPSVKWRQSSHISTVVITFHFVFLFFWVNTWNVPWKQHTIMPSIDHANTIPTIHQIFCLYWVVNLSKQNSQITPNPDFCCFFLNIWWMQRQTLPSGSENQHLSLLFHTFVCDSRNCVAFFQI